MPHRPIPRRGSQLVLASWVGLNALGCGEISQPNSASFGTPDTAGNGAAKQQTEQQNTGTEAAAVAPLTIAADAGIVSGAVAPPSGNMQTGAEAGEPGPAQAPTSRCVPTDVSRSPSTVTELVELVNALPLPTSLPCFLESLERPLEIYISRSGLSAQPAVSADSPRVFVLIENFVMSVVLGGPAGDTLEFGERLQNERSVRGELGFPLRSKVTPESMRAQIAVGATSLCGNCHGNEVPARPGFYAGAIESNIVLPNEFFFVELDQLQDSWASCDSANDANRCELLDALLGHGEVVQVAFR